MRTKLPKEPVKKIASGVATSGKSRGLVLKKHLGVVSYYVHGPTGKIKGSDFTTAKLIEVVRVGLPVQELRDLQTSLDVTVDKLIPMLGISKATFRRRQAEGRLDQSESDRVVRFARLMGIETKSPAQRCAPKAIQFDRGRVLWDHSSSNRRWRRLLRSAV